MLQWKPKGKADTNRYLRLIVAASGLKMKIKVRRSASSIQSSIRLAAAMSAEVSVGLQAPADNLVDKSSR